MALTPPGRRVFRDEGGQSTLEFLIALPLLAGTFTILTQFLILLHVRTVVDYAAFCAARSAAVWLPTELVEQGAASPSEAQQRIQRSAAVACVPISPRIGALIDNRVLSAPAMSEGIDLPGVALLVGSVENLEYALRATTVDLETRILEGERGVKGRLVIATVRFKHQLFLPIASRVFGGASAPPGLEAVRGEFAEVVGVYALPIEDDRISGWEDRG